MVGSLSTNSATHLRGSKTSLVNILSPSVLFNGIISLASSASKYVTTSLVHLVFVVVYCNISIVTKMHAGLHRFVRSPLNEKNRLGLGSSTCFPNGAMYLPIECKIFTWLSAKRTNANVWHTCCTNTFINVSPVCSLLNVALWNSVKGVIITGATSGRVNTVCFNDTTRWVLVGVGGTSGTVVGRGISVIGLVGGVPRYGTTGNSSSGFCDGSTTERAMYLGGDAGSVPPSNASI